MDSTTIKIDNKAVPPKKPTIISTLINSYFQLYPIEAAKLLSNFSKNEVHEYLRFQNLSNAAEIFIRLNPEMSAALMEDMDDNLFKDLSVNIDPSISARLLSRLDEKTVQHRLSQLNSSLARELRELMEYPPETAGYLMDTIISTFQPEDTVEEVLNRIRRVQDRRVVNINVVDEDKKLIGIIPLQEVAVSESAERLKDLPWKQPVVIQAMSPQDEVVQLLEDQKLLSLPVVDINGILLGVIRYDALVRVSRQEATEDLQAMFGAGRDERALSKVTFAIRKRLPWLEINLATAFLAAAVVGLFEETIAQITVLAVFLPVVAGQSGNTGSQALAVTMRGLALREIRGRHWFRVARKEIMVGFLNGCAVSLTTSLIVLIWVGSLGLAGVIAISMIISMVIAGFSGAIIPILLKAFGQDPAQSSSIILTTVTDVVGFFSFLGLATLFASTFNIL
jgi:magnesium transporter